MKTYTRLGFNDIYVGYIQIGLKPMAKSGSYGNFNTPLLEFP